MRARPNTIILLVGGWPVGITGRCLNTKNALAPSTEVGITASGNLQSLGRTPASHGNGPQPSTTRHNRRFRWTLFLYKRREAASPGSRRVAGGGPEGLQSMNKAVSTEVDEDLFQLQMRNAL